MSAKRTKKPRSKTSKLISNGLDANARAWAKLLADPCNAPMASPAYTTGNGGTLIRVESDGLYSTSATSTAGSIMFTPGLLARVGTFNAIAYIDATTDGASIPWSGGSLASQPGYSASANWGAVRCVAACLQVSWPGSELNRQGVVSIGQFPSSIFNQSLSVAQIRSASPVVTRMPDSIMEVKWRPGERDNLYEDPSVSNLLTDLEGRNSLVASYAGMPVSTGVRIRLVAVYEFVPSVFAGDIVSLTTNSNSATRNTTNEILGALDAAGKWAYSVATSPAAAMLWDVGQNMVKGAARAAPLLLL